MLGVSDADWHAVRSAYRNNMRRWHPDRTQHTSHHELAEEKTKEINHAYKILSDYYKHHGHLPPFEDGPTHPRSNSTSTPGDPEPAASTLWTASAAPDNDAKQHRPTRRYRWVLATAAAVAATYLLWDEGHRSSSHPSVQNPHEMTSHPAEEKLFGAVATALTERDVDDQRSPSTDAFTKTNHSPRSFSYTAPRATFTVGSSSAEVLSAQGAPVQQTNSVWQYGRSKVYFQDDRVTGWHENPMSPLALRR